jgi:hypothetical protein
LLKSIILAFDDVAKDQDDLPAGRTLFYFDSGHDTNILPLMKAIEIDYPYLLPFNTSLFFELHEDDVNKKLFVKVFLDDIELDIHKLDRAVVKENNINQSKQDSETSKAKFLAKSNPEIDEPNHESSFYFYLKRNLMRRMLSENVESYCNKRIEDLGYFNLKKYEVETSSSHMFVFIIISSSLGIFIVTALIIFQ